MKQTISLPVPQAAQRQPGIPRNKYVTDDLLIATLVAHGQPKHSAVELRRNPPLRLAAMRFWADVQASGKGDMAARERVDYCRQAWDNMRKADLIADNPGRFL